MKATEAMIPLVMLFDDEEEDVRVEAVQALIETAGVVGALLPILKNVRYLSTWMSLRLSKEVISAGSVAVPSLLEGLDSQYETIRKFALWMLGELKDHTAVTELLKRLDLYGVDEKALTLLALGKIGDERALDAVVRYTHYPLEQIRIAASSAIGSLGAPTLIPLLEQIILTDWLPVKIAAATALGRLEDEGKQRLQQLLTNEQSLVRSLAEQVLDELEYSRKV
jgi:HEAT repeat protein